MSLFYDFTEDTGAFLVQKPLTKQLGLLTPSVDEEGRIFSGLGYHQPKVLQKPIPPPQAPQWTAETM